MPEARSALAGRYRPGRSGAPDDAPGVRLAEVRGLDVIQLAAWPDTFDEVYARLARVLPRELPANYRHAAGDEVTVFMTGPERLLIVAPETMGLYGKLTAAFPPEQAVVTGLGHGRTVLRLSGPKARAVLAKGLPIDVDESAFPVGAFAQSMLEEVAALVHRRDDHGGDPVFGIYVSRSLAHAAFEWLIEAAAEFGCEVEEPL